MGKYSNVRVVSDGIGPGTQVLVEGKPIKGLLGIKWEMESPDLLGRLTLIIDAAEIDAEAWSFLLENATVEDEGE